MDIVILASLDKIQQANLCQKAMMQHYGDFNIKLLAPADLYQKIDRYDQIEYIDEDSILNKNDFLKLFNSKFGSITRATWYYQQFLKYSYGYYDHCKDKSYVVWDSDTIPLRRFNFVENGKYLYNRKTEQCIEYFRTIYKLFKNIDCSNYCEYGHSFISEYMIFDKAILKEMLYLFGENWIDFILDRINIKDIFWIGFSEFETYGTYISNFHRDTFKNVQLKTYRKGFKIFDKIPTYQELIDKKLDLDTISFEHYHRKTPVIEMYGRLGNILFQLAKHISDGKIEYNYFSKERNGIIENINWLFGINIKACIPQKQKLIKFSGYWQSEKYFNVDLIRGIFKINQHLIDNVQKKYEDIDFGNCVGIHVRLGDYLKYPVFRVLPSDYYSNAYKNHFNGMKCIVFSDNIEKAKDIIKIENAVFIDGQSELEDLCMYAMCRHHINSASTFSWWGSWLLEKPDSVNIFPKQWFNFYRNEEEKDIDENIIPSRWIREE